MTCRCPLREMRECTPKKCMWSMRWSSEDGTSYVCAVALIAGKGNEFMLNALCAKDSRKEGK